ncbi:MAG: carbohydrate kinase [Roseobacter sp.]
MILCCGEALIDMIPTPTRVGGTGFVPHSGGAIFNTAIALGRLGVKTGFLTGLSTDIFGTQLEADLERSNVDASLAIRSDLPTTLAFVSLKNGHATYTFYDENTAGRSLTPDQLPALPADVSTLYFGGISLISEPCADFYAALAEAESGRRTIVVDPNIRPGFIKNAARYRARLERMLAVADIVKVSDEDLDWIIDSDAPMAKKVMQLQTFGPRMVVVTRGSAGASAYLSGHEEVRVAAPKATVVDTVGAGDTFNAGMIAALSDLSVIQKENLSTLSEETASQALRKGAAVAAVTVSRAGANPPWAHELESALQS